MSTKVFLNNGWKFCRNFEESMLSEKYDDSAFESVRIPHSVTTTPFNCFDAEIYQTESFYKKSFKCPAEWEGKSIRLTFEAVAHKAVVYINGTRICTHCCGYTAFTQDVSQYLKYDADNSIMVRVDSRENLNQPPFGFVIDYMTYGGIYRDVYFSVSEKEYIEDVFLQSEFADADTVLRADVTLSGEERSGLFIKLFMNDVALECSVQKQNAGKYIVKAPVTGAERWDIDNPKLYSVRTELWDKDVKIDEYTAEFGFRTAEFKADGFYLNGKKVKIRGLNRHQSFPYAGYAMPASMQINDAVILKNELSVNAVRTSHYPQSHDFISACDRLGLLVFTEIPGWQHIGDDEWKEQAVKNVSDMILQYRNHPSIILWGVRINESVDSDGFYKKTNEVAHSLDSTRATGGVRVSKKSHLFEDVYTYNDFVHDGKARGCDKKSSVTPDMSKAYLISEYNGHMYPTKPFDCEEHRVEHALRHANVLDAVAGERDIAGSLGWCMFDYNTHKDFGSGDRICYHGVMDFFRNPKYAAAVYAAQEEKTPLLEVMSSMDIGDHPGGNRGKTWIVSNADSVKMYKNGRFVKEYFPKDSPYKNLKHGPFFINDYIGDAVVVGEEGSESFKRQLTGALNETAIYGLANLPKRTLLKLAKMMLFDHVTYEDAVRYYGKYVGDWGKESTVFSFEAIKNGETVKTTVKSPMKALKIEGKCDHTMLAETETYDVAAIRLRACDQNGNTAYYFNEPVRLVCEGDIEIIGPDTFSLKGGMGGTYVRTKPFAAGKATVTVKSEQCDDVMFLFEISKEQVLEL